MDIHIEYILSFLEDELKDLQGLRIHPVAPSKAQKAVDMPQNYDPHESNVHTTRGVRVRAGSREYFFPAQWAADGEFQKIKDQAEEIRTFYFD